MIFELSTFNSVNIPEDFYEVNALDLEVLVLCGRLLVVLGGVLVVGLVLLLLLRAEGVLVLAGDW